MYWVSLTADGGICRAAAAGGLARSLDCEQRDALAELTAGFDDNAEEIEELEDLLADAVRLAATTDAVMLSSSGRGRGYL
jgi:hypothetical protein